MAQGHRRGRAIWDLVEGLHSRRDALDPACTDSVREEIREHEEALRTRHPGPGKGPTLVE